MNMSSLLFPHVNAYTYIPLNNKLKYIIFIPTAVAMS